ncbi:MAG: hypothetical protein IIC83_06695 [Chloroflexi bacterium]|nr:hypothetical protein [Chloroflexota bacterium]
MRLGSTLEADKLECEDQEYQELCLKYNIRRKLQIPVIFVGGLHEWQAIKSKLDEAKIPEAEIWYYAALINGYMSFAAEMDADFIAQNSWTWDVLRLKMLRANQQFPRSTATSVPAVMECIDVVDFDKISSDDLRTLRRNEEAFANWRADISLMLAISDQSDNNFQELVHRFDLLSSDILPKRAMEIESAIKKTSLRQHLSDAAFGFSAATLAGLQEGDLEKILVKSTATSASRLLLSILFRRTKSDGKILNSLYTMLAKKDKSTGWVTPM